MPTASLYDCIIIGGGLAGLTCTIFLGRYRLRVLLFDGEKMWDGLQPVGRSG